MKRTEATTLIADLAFAEDLILAGMGVNATEYRRQWERDVRPWLPVELTNAERSTQNEPGAP